MFTHRARSGFSFAILCLGTAGAFGLARPSAKGLAASSAATSAASSAAQPVLEGAWQAREYRLASGVSHPVRGRIFFTSDEWQVLFFVMDGDEPHRGSGEGGRYTLEGDELTFEHLFHLSAGDEMEGLPASPLTLTAREGEGPLEPTRAEVEGDRLALHFPTGNVMTFGRSSRP